LTKDRKAPERYPLVGHPDASAYRLLIEDAWRDLHHSRLQEWSALGIVAGAHFAIFQVIKLLKNTIPKEMFSTLVLLGTIVGGLFAVLGMLITLRHRRLMRVKLNWIFQAEEKLGLIMDDQNPDGIIPRKGAIQYPVEWKGLDMPRPFSTSFLIMAFYFLLIVIDVIVMVFSSAL
jgi:hypothetical protein